MGVHLSHNGDFDSFRCYNSSLVQEELGFWLERVLHTPNTALCDSSKACGMMDLMRVQGRWAASCRLAYVRTILLSASDVCGGVDLSPSAPNTFPKPSFFQDLGQVMESIWTMHIDNIIKRDNELYVSTKKVNYSIDRAGKKQFIDCIVEGLRENEMCTNWTRHQFHSFVSSAVTGFLTYDL